MIDVFLSAFPIALLIWLMTKRKGMPSSQALPLVAVLMYLIQLIYFARDPNTVHATVLWGLLTALTPILNVLGAIFLFRTMERSGAMDTVRRWLNSISSNPVAQLMIVGWAFAFLIEGASGFGTPAALAAPILVGLGFPAVRVAILCLIMNTVPVSFGAVGTPTWFGFGDLDLSVSEMQTTGFKSALMHTGASLVIPVIALWFVLGWEEIRRNIVFVYLSIAACVVPYVVLSRYNYEFPAILGGMIGLILTVAIASRGIGLVKCESKDDGAALVPLRDLIRAGFPLWGTVLVLLVTRVEQLGIKGWLTHKPSEWVCQLGSLGAIGTNRQLVVTLDNIFGSGVRWNHQFLYVPSIIPFLLISGITFLVFRMNRDAVKQVTVESVTQMRNPVIALLGALALVKLLMMGGPTASTKILGGAMADAAGTGWRFAAVYLGALGSFFSGSNTISNLTFGGIQYSIADDLHLPRTTILAMQSAGGAMGNMVCINNIVAVCSVLGLEKQEGHIIKRTVIPVVVYGVIVALIGLAADCMPQL